MNRVHSSVLLLSLVVILLILPCGCGKKADEHPTPTVTLTNLQSAYAKELTYREMYLRFAERATKEHLDGAARLYRALARSEAIHASNHAVLIRSLGAAPVEPLIQPVVVGTTMQTLKLALSTEAIEAGSFYPNLIKTAQAEHAAEAVRQFTAVMNADMHHADLLSKAFRENGRVTEKHFLICPMCGFVTTVEAAKDCAGCGVPKANFEVI
jgi:rubrerythrin